MKRYKRITKKNVPFTAKLDMGSSAIGKIEKTTFAKEFFTI